MVISFTNTGTVEFRLCVGGRDLNVCDQMTNSIFISNVEMHLKITITLVNTGSKCRWKIYLASMKTCVIR